MGDGPRGIKVFSDHFEVSTSGVDSPQAKTPSISHPRTDNTLRSHSRLWSRRKLRNAASMLKMFSLPRLPWGPDTDDQEKVVLTAAEIESLRSELADLEEREAHLKAQLEHIDEILRSARLSGYLFIRTRWATVPGEPPPIDDTEVDDWLPRYLVFQGSCIFFYLLSTDMSPQDSTLLSDVTEVGPLPCIQRENEETRYCFYIVTRQGLRYECSSVSKVQGFDHLISHASSLSLSFSQLSLYTAKAQRRNLVRPIDDELSEGRAVASAATVLLRGKVPYLASYGRTDSGNTSRGWISGALALPAAAYMLQEQEVHAAEMERTFIAIKPDGVQRGLIAEIISRFERKGFKLVAIKIVVPSKDFAQKHYHDLKERPFFNGLCDFLSSGPVIAMVWEGEGVIKYGRKLIGATDPQKSEPGTIRGDLAVVVGRNIIHGSDGPETAQDEIKLWFKPEELVSYMISGEKWIYGDN
ncbi:hypothetical protein TEA_005078 [Camellia sinensis var. sinensis]|uniref:Nucleoside diphosphate kinase n=1 Tax=Camellia sinensis var. sinensis TaxID=542762 RepID=A0A4S4DYL0_CAMSN|nr:hypothetical protein TEA_005078 [Camellia sinensis var. sinensis]